MKLTAGIRREDRVFLLLVSFIVFAFGGCARKIVFQTSTVEPAAVGKVKIKKDRNNNYSMQVSVEHLGSPQRLTPAKEVYVVWAETPDNQLKNVGRIVVGASMFSKELTGSLNTVLLYQPRRVFISAEMQAQVDSPGTQVVMTTSSF